MQATAKLSHLRISSRKVRLVADLIRGLPVAEAECQLNFLAKRAALPMTNLLKSAVANAENNAKLVKENLYISKIMVNQGPMLKRWRARARGSANEIKKRTSHIILVLDEIKPGIRKDKTQIKKAEKQSIQPAVEDKEKKVKTFKKTYPETGQKDLSRSKISKVKRMFRRKSI